MDNSQNNAVTPSQFKIDSVILVNYMGVELNISYVGAIINIYEDILANCISGNIVLNDANNLIANFPIIGQEKLRISYSTLAKSGRKSEIALEFSVYGIQRHDKSDESRNEVYTLEFCSNEAILNAKKRISKSLSGDPAELVGDILQEEYGLNSEKNYAYTKSKCVENLVVPYWSPFQTINWLQKRAISDKYKGATYMLYETTREFRFEPLEAMFERESVKRFIYSPHNFFPEAGRRDYKYEESKIDRFSRAPHFNVLADMRDGKYGSHLVTHDVFSKKITFTDFNLIDTYDDYVHCEGAAGKSGQGIKIPVSKSKDQYGKSMSEYPTSHIEFYPTHEKMFVTETRSTPEEWVSQRISQLQQLDGISITVGVSGDSDLTIGQMVDVFILSDEDLSKADDPYDKIISGRYLITSIAHTMSRAGYDMVIRLNKDSVRVPIL